MASEFKGNPAPLQDGDYNRAARKIGCSVPAVRAVAQVEGQAGYLSDGRPKILFERHKFHRYSGGRHTGAHPDISFPRPGNYRGGAREYDRLAKAIRLDREAALQSASWGAFQIMGFNYRRAGHNDVESFVRAMVESAGKQLDGFIAFIINSRLDDELRRRDWAGFARGYNGRNYKINRYDKKLANAYDFYASGGSRTDNPHPLLKLGSRGPEVAHLQQLLKITMDGDFGPATKAAVQAFQKKKKLHADGIVGQQTWDALLATKSDSVATKKAWPVLRQGDKGEDVAYLQAQLKIPADGDFGPGTHKAVVAFQKKHRLVADGIFGRKSWSVLLGA